MVFDTATTSFEKYFNENVMESNMRKAGVSKEDVEDKVK